MTDTLAELMIYDSEITSLLFAEVHIFDKTLSVDRCCLFVNNNRILGGRGTLAGNKNTADRGNV